MENMEVNNFLENISYNTYYTAQKHLFLSSFCSTISKFLIEMPDEFKTSIILFSIVTGSLYLVMHFSGGIEHTKEVKQIDRLYKEFIMNYNKLNRIFDFNDPVQVYAMFKYLTYNGYLSVGKEFNFTNSQSRDLKSILGANVITGKGVCRHIASMLTDILNDYNIEAGTLGVCAETVSVDIEALDEQKYTKEELLNWLHSYPLTEELLDVLTKFVERLAEKDALNFEFLFKIEKEKNIFKRIIGNHAITYAYKDDKSYYLDPTQGRIYRKNDMVLSDSEIIASPRITMSTLFNNRVRYSNMKARINNNYPSLDVVEQDKIISDTLDICKDNMDIIDNFYRYNYDLYRETSRLMLSLKKK